eukprot:CAMPEP_0179032682 /NCGR_PEP_ID=MMETSP0796-20121207/11712_1 /TAXON_ID=73915 /ORGANISM="Pyrodinium bahamense, Strain pbaha01" /LENGTH=231 /DNA_ID=CAMNT_0020728913 /DNA_START=20 /DNA_END=716 /DNA_ORIENTATION=+
MTLGNLLHTAALGICRTRLMTLQLGTRSSLRAMQIYRGLKLFATVLCGPTLSRVPLQEEGVVASDDDKITFKAAPLSVDDNGLPLRHGISELLRQLLVKVSICAFHPGLMNRGPKTFAQVKQVFHIHVPKLLVLPRPAKPPTYLAHLRKPRKPIHPSIAVLGQSLAPIEVITLLGNIAPRHAMPISGIFGIGPNIRATVAVKLLEEALARIEVRSRESKCVDDLPPRVAKP